jgi:hypothetical protein
MPARPRHRLPTLAVLPAVVSLVTGTCPAAPEAAFSLPDVNPASDRSGAQVSPRDYLGRVTVWYFGHEG